MHTVDRAFSTHLFESRRYNSVSRRLRNSRGTSTPTQISPVSNLDDDVVFREGGDRRTERPIYGGEDGKEKRRKPKGEERKKRE